MTFGSLFAGIGGFDLGLERAGMECRWQVEIDPFARKVLAKHWPDVRRWDDVRTFPPEPLEDWTVDLICGGFPCQDLSFAGRGAGIDGERSGLYREIIRLIRVLRPRFVVMENVSALLVRGLDRVLGDLVALGLDAEWECLPAAAFGAPHFRDRIFLLAHSDRFQRGLLSVERNPRAMGRRVAQASRSGEPETAIASSCRDGLSERTDPAESGTDDADDRGTVRRGIIPGASWLPEPGVQRMADGLPSELDAARLKAVGNAVVPQVAEWIGRRILEADRSSLFPAFGDPR